MTTFSRQPLVNLIILLAILILFSTEPAKADTMSNSQYIIRFGTINEGGGVSSNSQYKLGESIGQNAPGLYSGTNYTVKAGFEYYKKASASASPMPTPTPFSFGISNSLLNFGVITPTNPLTRPTNLTVSGASNGFTVTASENKQLSSQTSVIPDTACDAGCTSIKASSWKSSLAYGFGYRCDALLGQTNVCPSDFAVDFFRPFAATPSESTVISSSSNTQNASSQITYKVNVSGTQSPGVYSNIIQYIANPGF